MGIIYIYIYIELYYNSSYLSFLRHVRLADTSLSIRRLAGPPRRALRCTVRQRGVDAAVPGTGAVFWAERLWADRACAAQRRMGLSWNRRKWPGGLEKKREG